MFCHVDCETISHLNKDEGPSGRFYITPDGSKYPSITTVLGQTSDKTWLEEWKNKVGVEEARRVAKRATNRGTRIHKIIEDYLDNKPISGLSYVDKSQFESIKGTLDLHIDNIRHQEAHLYSDYFQIAGQVDCIADFHNRLSIIDFKTSREKKFENDILDYYLQATFYAYAYYEMFGIKIKYIVILIIVDFDKPQIFISKPEKHLDELRIRRLQYKDQYNV